MKITDYALRIGYCCVWIVALMMGVAYGIQLLSADPGSDDQQKFLVKMLVCGGVWLTGVLAHTTLIQQEEPDENS